jgi:hypothetical protein
MNGKGFRSISGAERGEWDSGTVYSGGDIVRKDGDVWQARRGSTGIAPTVSPTSPWFRLCAEDDYEAPGGLMSWGRLSLTVGVYLPHHVRRASGDANGRRRRTIRVPNIHLWLASPGAIWRVFSDVGTAAEAFGGLKVATKACASTYPDGTGAHTPAILRDDRPALAQMHHLAWEWYGQSRRTIKFAIRDLCVGSFTDSVRGEIPYPKIGQTLDTVTMLGQVQTIRTPVTSISYDNATGVTYFGTDWTELDFGSIPVQRG